MWHLFTNVLIDASNEFIWAAENQFRYLMIYFKNNDSFFVCNKFMFVLLFLFYFFNYRRSSFFFGCPLSVHNFYRWLAGVTVFDRRFAVFFLDSLYLSDVARCSPFVNSVNIHISNIINTHAHKWEYNRQRYDGNIAVLLMLLLLLLVLVLLQLCSSK